MNPIIYRIYNISTQQSYIGQTYNSIEERYSKHKAKAFRRKVNTKLAKAMRDLGLTNFDYEIIEEINSLDFYSPQELQDYLDERELYWMTKYDSVKNGYNTNFYCQGYRNKSRNKDSKISYEELKLLFLDKNCRRDDIRKKIKISKGHFQRLVKQWQLEKSFQVIGKTSALTKMRNNHSSEQIEQFKNLYQVEHKSLKNIKNILGISYCSVLRLRDFINSNKGEIICFNN